MAADLVNLMMGVTSSLLWEKRFFDYRLGSGCRLPNWVDLDTLDSGKFQDSKQWCSQLQSLPQFGQSKPLCRTSSYPQEPLQHCSSEPIIVNRCCCAKCSYDLLDLCTNGPKEKLDSTIISQPAIYVTSLAAVEVLRACDGGQDVINSVDVTCGLSLGEYTALAFAGAFSFEDGLKLVKLRGEAIQDASDAANSAMIKRLFPIRMAYES